jgi:hypothetical protein
MVETEVLILAAALARFWSGYTVPVSLFYGMARLDVSHVAMALSSCSISARGLGPKSIWPFLLQPGCGLDLSIPGLEVHIKEDWVLWIV